MAKRVRINWSTVATLTVSAVAVAFVAYAFDRLGLIQISKFMD